MPVSTVDPGDWIAAGAQAAAAVVTVLGAFLVVWIQTRQAHRRRRAEVAERRDIYIRRLEADFSTISRKLHASKAEIAGRIAEIEIVRSRMEVDSGSFNLTESQSELELRILLLSKQAAITIPSGLYDTELQHHLLGEGQGELIAETVDLVGEFNSRLEVMPLVAATTCWGDVTLDALNGVLDAANQALLKAGRFHPIGAANATISRLGRM